ncbi:unnamed protein product, partial [Thelazia callipaeda]|uniref:Anaphase-promoting complex subunit 11 n=1 Tax=Thelazia callipaeda TaxID=103827 RepID=A0A0N5D7R3_THECL
LFKVERSFQNPGQKTFKGKEGNENNEIKSQSYTLPTQTRLKLSVRKMNMVAKWHWNIEEGPCGICREMFESCCVSCRTPGDECPIAIGICRHAFHMHCIVKWTKSQRIPHPPCPLCRQTWKFAPLERAKVRVADETVH